VKNLSHNASFESFDKDAPSKPGTKHLVRASRYICSHTTMAEPRQEA
jgi:hypothetical protein